ncbi:MAG: hypothetical protein ILO34_03035 [Kiritimatiellae bacterium]|nr:hypothetical protein [Kiritimatiellia bacterium]
MDSFFKKSFSLAVAVALTFCAVSCKSSGNSKGERKGNGNESAGNVSVSLTSDDRFVGLDEWKNADGKVNEDSLTYISMPNDAEKVLKIAIEANARQYDRFELRVNNPNAFRVGLQSPANSETVTLRSGDTSSVYIRSFYNTPGEPRMQIDTMVVVGYSDKGQTALRRFRIGSYKKACFDLKFVKVKRADALEYEISGLWPRGNTGILGKAQEILNPMIVDVSSVDVETRTVDYDLNGNGVLDMFAGEQPFEEFAGSEIGVLDQQLTSHEEVVVALVEKVSFLVKVIGKQGDRTLMIYATENLGIARGDEYYLAKAENVYDASARAEVRVNQYDTNNQALTLDASVDIAGSDGYVLMSKTKRTNGAARTPIERPESIRNNVYNLVVALAGGVMDSYDNEAVPFHEIGHVFGLSDVVDSKDNNMMMCKSNLWNRAGTPKFHGRPHKVAKSGATGCPEIQSKKPESQWDSWIREPIWML